jgi:hypothetical protein
VLPASRAESGTTVQLTLCGEHHAGLFRSSPRSLINQFKGFFWRSASNYLVVAMKIIVETSLARAWNEASIHRCYSSMRAVCKTDDGLARLIHHADMRGAGATAVL